MKNEYTIITHANLILRKSSCDLHLHHDIVLPWPLYNPLFEPLLPEIQFHANKWALFYITISYTYELLVRTLFGSSVSHIFSGINSWIFKLIVSLLTNGPTHKKMARGVQRLGHFGPDLDAFCFGLVLSACFFIRIPRIHIRENLKFSKSYPLRWNFTSLFFTENLKFQQII